MSNIENKITKLGYKLPNESAPLANYVPVVITEKSKLIFTAGHLPKNNEGEIFKLLYYEVENVYQSSFI